MRPGVSPAFDFKDIIDVTLVTGSQATATIDRTMTAGTRNPNIRAAMAYMESRRRKFSPEGFLNLQFTRASTKQRYALTYLPYVDISPSPQFPVRDSHHVIIIADGPRGTGVWIASAIVSPDGRTADVKEDAAVVEGKVDPSKGIWRAIMKCSLQGCITAAVGCLAAGSAFPTCLTLGCGASVIGCIITENLLPWP